MSDNKTDQYVFTFGDYNDTITITGSDYWNNSMTTSSTPLSTTLGGSGTMGATLSTASLGSLSWNNPTYTATASPSFTITTPGTTTGWTTNYNQHNVLKVQGDAEFEGDIKIKGVNLSQRLDAIEERLGILRPNSDLEGKWEKLKALGDEYRKLEKDILEKEKIWDLLKK